MCGIAGRWGGGFKLEELEQQLRTMVAAIAHRGPDGAGLAISPLGGLGHVRLSIIDLEQGAQPMAARDHGLWISFNGELFNYRELRQELEQQGEVFVSKSDTEVVLRSYARWGKSCLKRFNGQYAFAIADPKQDQLFLARDPFGERPLFWHRRAKVLSFCSEAKGLLTCPDVTAELDLEALHSSFGSWTLQPQQSSFRDIQQLAPGHWMTFKQGQLEIGQHYQLPDLLEEQSQLTAKHKDSHRGEMSEELKAKLCSSLGRSVSLRLRSDVEVGCYLSGGLDSTITTALAAERCEKVHSYSIRFPQADYDEGHEQGLAQRQLGTEHESVLVHEKDIADIFPQVILHAECPQFRTAAAPLFLLARRVRERGLKVVLTGEGADEFFLGYNLFKEILLRQQLPQLDDDSACAAIAALYPYLPHFDSAMAKRQLPIFRRSCGGLDDSTFSHRMRYRVSQWNESFLAPGKSAQEQWVDSLKRWPGFEARSTLGKGQELERLNLLGGYLLSSQGDRMAMAHGIETRAPFLDPEVVAMAQSLALDHKIKGGHNEKFALKASFGKRLPAAIVERAKQPYRAMEASCFCSNKPLWYLEACAVASLKRRHWLDASRAQRLFRKAEDDPMGLSPRENQSVIAILSTILLEDQLIHQRWRPGLNHNLSCQLMVPS